MGPEETDSGEEYASPSLASDTQSKFLVKLYRLLDSDNSKIRETLWWSEDGTQILVADADPHKVLAREFGGVRGLRRMYASLASYGFKRTRQGDTHVFTHRFLKRDYPRHELASVTVAEGKGTCQHRQSDTIAASEAELDLEVGMGGNSSESGEDGWRPERPRMSKRLSLIVPLADINGDLSVKRSRQPLARSTFLPGLYRMISPSTRHIICWDDSGSHISIIDESRLEDAVRTEFGDDFDSIWLYKMLYAYGFRKSPSLAGPGKAAEQQIWTHSVLDRNFPQHQLPLAGKRACNNPGILRGMKLKTYTVAYEPSETATDTEMLDVSVVGTDDPNTMVLDKGEMEVDVPVVDEFLLNVFRATEYPSNNDLICWDATGRVILLLGTASVGALIGTGYTGEFKKRGFAIVAVKHGTRYVAGWSHPGVDRAYASGFIGSPS